MTVGNVPVDNALNPAWRDTVVHLISEQEWDDTLPGAVAKRTIDEMTNGKGYSLRQLAPDTGAYVNGVCLLYYIQSPQDYSFARTPGS